MKNIPTVDSVVEEFDVLLASRMGEHSDVYKKWTEIKDLYQERDRIAREDERKAFGGCTNCYGKGYSTVKNFTVGHEDFGGEGFRRENSPMRFCTCDRGEQLKGLTTTR